MKVEARTEHYWVDVETNERFETRLDAEIHALHRELCKEMAPFGGHQRPFLMDIARYICGNYELTSLRDEDNPKNWETRADEGHAS